MRIGTLKSLCAAAVAAALALPAFAQESERTFEAGQGANAARGAAGEAGTVGPGARQEVPGATPRPGQPGVVIEEERTIENEALDRPGTRTANYPPGQGRAAGRIDDAALVRWITAPNEGEIKVNELAQQQAESDQVKQFAAKMVEEHTQFGDQLQQASAGGQPGQPGQPGASGRSTTIEQRTTRRAPGAQPGAQNDAQENQENAEDATENRRERDSARPNRTEADEQSPLSREPRESDSTTTRTTRTESRAAGGAGQGGNNPFVALHEEISEACAQSTIKALQEKQGKDFDHAFMHQQVMAHMAMLDTLKVAGQKAQGQQLKQTLQQGQQTTQQHLQEAKQILEQIEKQGQQ